MPGYAGLQTNPATWLIFAGLCLCWMASLRLVPGWTQEGWPSLFKSLYGLVWMGFGLDIVLRFAALSYNSVEWSTGSLRLMALPPDTVNRTLVCSVLYWAALCMGCAVGVRRAGPGPFRYTAEITPQFAYAVALPTAFLASLGFYLTEGEAHVPLALLTPIALLSNLYMVPAAIIWWDHFRRPEPKWRVGAIHVVVLLPGIVRAWLSPYRENLTVVIAIPLLAAIFAGQRPRLRKLVPAGLVWLLLASTLIAGYRRIEWDNARPSEVVAELRHARLSDWFSGSQSEPLRRFHGFDSMLLTEALVPALEPHSGRNLLIMPFVHGFVPRFLDSGKSTELVGTTFGERIWGFDDPQARERRVGNIAPSMPGDLFDAGGLLFVGLGGMLWGLLVGLVDGWKKHLPGFAAAALTSVTVTHCAMSVERDFDMTVATFIQSLLVLALAAAAIGLVKRLRAEPSYLFPPDRNSSGLLGASWRALE